MKSQAGFRLGLFSTKQTWQTVLSYKTVSEKLTCTYAVQKLHDDDMTEGMTSHVIHDFSKLCHAHNCKQMLCQRLLSKTKVISQGTSAKIKFVKIKTIILRKERKISLPSS